MYVVNSLGSSLKSISSGEVMLISVVSSFLFLSVAAWTLFQRSEP